MKRYLRHTILAFTFSASVLFGGMAVYGTPGTSTTAFSLERASSSLLVIIHSSLADTSILVTNNPASTQGATQDPSSSQANTPNKTARSFFSNWFLQPFRRTPAPETEKLISNVKVFPSPAVEAINLSFRLGKRSEVSIKVMDALGNEMLTLLNQTMDPGTQNQSFEIQGKLSSGMYFLRVTAGTETVIKRVSVL